MESIKANGYWKRVARSYWVLGYVYYTYYTVRYSVPVPYLYSVWVPGYKLWGVIPIPGHYEPRLGIRWVTRSYRIPIPHYVPPKIGIYYTYVRFPDLIPASKKTSRTTIVPSVTTGSKVSTANMHVYSNPYDAPSTQWKQGKTLNQRYVISHLEFTVLAPLDLYITLFNPGGIGRVIGALLYGLDVGGVNIYDWEGMKQPAWI